MSSTNNLKSYGCVECQLRHYSFQDIYQEHIMLQSRHGLEDVSNEEAALALFPTRSAPTSKRNTTKSCTSTKIDPSIPFQILGINEDGSVNVITLTWTRTVFQNVDAEIFIHE